MSENKLIVIEREIVEAGLDDLKSGFEKALKMADLVAKLSDALTPESMKSVMKLQGSTLGFRTDKDSNGGYSIEIVRNALIEAVMRGLQPVGNHFNIISGRCYITKEGFSYLLKNLPGLTDYRELLDVPRDKSDKGAIVQSTATWKLNGKSDKWDGPIAVKKNAGMGIDAILGKASRKLKARVYAQITGSEVSDGESDEGEFVDVESENVSSTESGKERGNKTFGQDDLDMGGDE